MVSEEFVFRGDLESDSLPEEAFEDPGGWKVKRPDEKENPEEGGNAHEEQA